MKELVITGAAGGIGAECVKLLLMDKNVRIHAIDSNEERLKRLSIRHSAEIRTGSLRIIQSSMGTYLECSEICSNIGGGISGLVYLAGINLSDLDTFQSHEIWNSVIDSNVKAAYWMAGLSFKNRSSEHLLRMVFTSSVSFRRGSYDSVVYSLAKAALVGLTRSMAKRVGEFGLVNAIAPGVIETEMSKPYISQNSERLKMQIPVKRIGQPSDVARLVRFLVSDECSYITGQTINIDGGLVNS